MQKHAMEAEGSKEECLLCQIFFREKEDSEVLIRSVLIDPRSNQKNVLLKVALQMIISIPKDWETIQMGVSGLESSELHDQWHREALKDKPEIEHALKLFRSIQNIKHVNEDDFEALNR